MKSIFAFIVGAAVGAIAALLYAPQSGEELRARIREEAELERQRLQAQYERGLTEMHARVDKVQQDVQTLVNQSKSPDGDEAVVELEAEATD